MTPFLNQHLAVVEHKKINIKGSLLLACMLLISFTATLAQSNDPFAEKKTPWWRVTLVFLLLALALLWYLGKLDTYLPAKYRSVAVLGDAAPSNVQVQPDGTAVPSGSAAPAP